MSGFDVRFSFIPPDRIRGRLIRNPNYGGPSVGIKGWTWRPEVSKNHGAKPSFHKALQVSIHNEGVRNPVLVWNLSEGLFLTFGGSRVSAAIACGLETIPAIINDYTGEFSAAQLVSEDNYQEYFADVPRTFEFGPDGADYHYHLERARRHEHDDAGLAWLDGQNPAWLNKEFPWLDPNTES